jgi:hypothetical protein
METKDIIRNLKQIREDGFGLEDLIRKLEGRQVEPVCVTVYDKAGDVMECAAVDTIDRAIQFGTTSVRGKSWWSFKVFSQMGAVTLVEFKNMKVSK